LIVLVNVDYGHADRHRFWYDMPFWQVIH